MKNIFLFLAIMLSSSILAQSFEGSWNGKLNVAPSISLSMILEISKAEGTYKAKLISVDQGNIAIHCNSITTDGANITLEFKAIGAKYVAVLSESKLIGNFTQSGATFKLEMQKTDSTKLNKPNRPQTPKPPFPYEQEEVTFTNRIEGNTLSGTLTIPHGKGKFPAVVLISGSGSTNRDGEVFEHKLFLAWADYLSRNNIAVLRFDDRGTGESKKTTKTPTTADLAYDNEAAVEFLRARKEFSKIGVVGISEGGVISFILAGDKSYKSPDFIVSMAGTGVCGADVLCKQQEFALKEAGLPEATIKSTMEQNRTLYNLVIKSKELNNDLRNSIDKYLNEIIPPQTSEEIKTQRKNEIITQLANPWFYYFLKFDPQTVISKTKIPVLAVNGTLDKQVDAKINLTAIEAGLKSAKNKNYTIKYLEGLNHLFQTAETGSVKEYAKIEETYSESALKLIAEWINKTAK